MDSLEKKLDEVLVKKAPVQLPENAKKWIVEYSPYFGLAFGIIGLLMTLGFWGAGHTVNNFASNVDALNRAYGIETTVSTPSLGITFWLALLALLGWSIINIVAFPGLKARSKAKGWNLLFYSTLVYALYDVFNAVYSSDIFSMIFPLVGIVVSLYFLFQIRSYYGTGKKVADKPVDSKPAADKATK